MGYIVLPSLYQFYLITFHYFTNSLFFDFFILLIFFKFFLIKTLIFIHRKDSNDLKSFQELMQWVKPWWNFSTSASNLASNLLKVIHILEGLQQAESPKYWMHVGCNQEYYWLTIQELNNLGNSTKYCFKIFDRGSWHEIYGDKILQHLSQEQKKFQPHIVQTLLETTRNEAESVLSTVHIWLIQFGGGCYKIISKDKMSDSGEDEGCW